MKLFLFLFLILFLFISSGISSGEILDEDKSREMFDFKIFFATNPQDFDYENPSTLFSGKFLEWDGNKKHENTKLRVYKKAQLAVKNIGGDIVIGKTRKTNTNMIMFRLDAKGSKKPICKEYLDSSTHLYGEKTLYYFDQTKNPALNWTTNKVEGSFDFSDYRISYSCLEIFSNKTKEVIVSLFHFISGDKSEVKKTLARILIECSEDEIFLNQQKNDTMKKFTFHWYIDQDDRELLRTDGSYLFNEVTEFSKKTISGQIKTDKGDIHSFFIDRITGDFTRKTFLKSFPNKLATSEGKCKKIDDSPKF